jgi:predicted transcriptional regulator
MITVDQIVEAMNAEVATSAGVSDRAAVAGYASDLLSCAMSRAKKDYVWVTLQSHVNVVAVASLLGLAAVIITEGNQPDHDTLARANEEGVTLLLTPLTTFSVVSELASLGLRGEP